MKLSISIFFIFFLAVNSFAQYTITGTVISEGDSLPIPKATITDDSLNQTKTDLNGKFSIKVDKIPTTLTFAFVSMLPRTVQVTSEDSLTVVLKPFALVHYYNSQKLGFYINSDLINNPIGGDFYFTSPYIFNQVILESSIGYQSNLKDDKLLNGNLSLEGLIRGRYLVLNLNTNYKKVSLEQNLNFTQKSLELNFCCFYDSIDLTVGYSNLIWNPQTESPLEIDGLTIGISRYFHTPLKLTASTKASIYDGLFGYQAKIAKRFNKIYTFAEYNQLDFFREFNLGLGFRITYILKDPNKY